jgi:hypothetical protein
MPPIGLTFLLARTPARSFDVTTPRFPVGSWPYKYNR